LVTGKLFPIETEAKAISEGNFDRRVEIDRQDEICLNLRFEVQELGTTQAAYRSQSEL